MKKINCYSKYDSYIYLFLLCLVIIVGILPFVLFKEDDFNIFKIIWIFIMVFSIMTSIYGFFYNRQYLYIKNGKFILQNPFVKIKELNIEECYYEISTLPSYFSWVAITDETWICIYLKNESNKFKYGVANSKQYNRIQLIYTKENLEIIENLFK